MLMFCSAPGLRATACLMSKRNVRARSWTKTKHWNLVTLHKYNNNYNTTVCKLCGAKITGKNTTNLKQQLHPEIHKKVSIHAKVILSDKSPCFCKTWNKIEAKGNHLWTVLIRRLSRWINMSINIHVVKFNQMCTIIVDVVVFYMIGQSVCVCVCVRQRSEEIGQERKKS